ncbi:hypothetical protein PMI14_03628 [Acidovorax sp. CF316]|uniref:DUF488 domain-containing protein n=1 Tax=Acidovorax sp. CF316 TaxID=1144317 RepID=UPI00026BD7AC|nr:DUF488 family protein [Acidovorax sp. CF316]EJE51689.1 hypothetical protein PMI14_03628 [Acidovorax sp. CF316]
MPLRIVRLGTPRVPGEGTRIGSVRRPPRGVPKAEFASQNWYDVWYPLLSPSAELMAQGQQAHSDKEWQAFVKHFRKELAQPEASRTLDLLATLSHHGAMSLGCYCENEARCHRSVLREELAGRGADIATD